MSTATRAQTQDAPQTTAQLPAPPTAQVPAPPPTESSKPPTGTFSHAEPSTAVEPSHEQATATVIGVAADDTLNLRATPGNKAQILEEIPPNATVTPTGRSQQLQTSTWQEVRYIHHTGWVNARFLNNRQDDAEGAPLPPPLFCFGNEPFWSLSWDRSGAAKCEETCEASAGLRVSPLTPSAFPDTLDFTVRTAEDDRFLSVHITKTGKCSDDMSDRVYPYAITAHGTPGDLQGCCHHEHPSKLTPRP